MKTLFLAAATVLALSAGSAYAESEGPFAVGEQWAAQNGNATVPATEYAKPVQAPSKNHAANVLFQTQDGNG